jgi:hypothetical protein
MQGILFFLRVQAIATSVQHIVGAKTTLWLIVCMYQRHAALFSSASEVWPCALCR